MFAVFRKAALDGCNAISKTQSNPLRLGSNANVAGKFAIVIILLFYRHIHQSVFAKYAAHRAT